jgi:hypothetical protein
MAAAASARDGCGVVPSADRLRIVYAKVYALRVYFRSTDLMSAHVLMLIYSVLFELENEQRLMKASRRTMECC